MMHRSVILWAEDNEDDACLMARAIKKAALSSSFIHVADGGEARDYLAGQGAYSDRAEYPIPQLILLDNQMPKMSGLDVLQWKQSRPELKDVPALMLSSSSQDRDKTEAYRLGAKGYLVKPTTFHDLLVQVKQIDTEWIQVQVESGSGTM